MHMRSHDCSTSTCLDGRRKHIYIHQPAAVVAEHVYIYTYMPTCRCGRRTSMSPSTPGPPAHSHVHAHAHTPCPPCLPLLPVPPACPPNTHLPPAQYAPSPPMSACLPPPACPPPPPTRTSQSWKTVRRFWFSHTTSTTWRTHACMYACTRVCMYVHCLDMYVIHRQRGAAAGGAEALDACISTCIHKTT